MKEQPLQVDWLPHVSSQTLSCSGPTLEGERSLPSPTATSAAQLQGWGHPGGQHGLCPAQPAPARALHPPREALSPRAEQELSAGSRAGSGALPAQGHLADYLSQLPPAAQPWGPPGQGRLHPHPHQQGDKEAAAGVWKGEKKYCLGDQVRGDKYIRALHGHEQKLHRQKDPGRVFLLLCIISHIIKMGQIKSQNLISRQGFPTRTIQIPCLPVQDTTRTHNSHFPS